VDWLTFIAELVKALAWPATVVAGIALLRRSLLQLIPGLRRLKYKDLELEFEKKLEAAKAEIVDAQLPVPAPPPPALPQPEVGALPQPTSAGVLDLPAMVETVERIAAASPRAGIAEAWRYVEIAVERALRRRQLSRPRSPRELRKLLEQQGLLRDRMGALLDDLRGMRNQAVHAVELELTPGQAVEYSLLAAVLITMLDPEAIPLPR
jgi:hypothetical protein